MQCYQLKKCFGERQVVDDLSLSVPVGEILTLLGPSGCGKTTVLRLIAGFERIDGGWIKVAGTIVAQPNFHLPPEKRRVGMVFQDYAIFPHLSVMQNVAFGLRGQLAVRAQEMLEMVGLTKLGNVMPHELSGGQQQRVALARALAPEPAVLLLDEPFSNLDATLRKQVRQEVRGLLKQSRATAIFVTHDQEEALLMGDRVAVMRAGTLEQVGLPEEVFHRPRTRFVASFLGQTDFLPGKVVGQGVETSLGILPCELNHAKGTKIEFALRPADVVILTQKEEGATEAWVTERQFAGIATIYRLRLADDTILHSLQPYPLPLHIGDTIYVRLRTPHLLPCFAV